MSTSNCINCSKSLPGQAEFCPACGQSVEVITRPWREIVGELLTELSDFGGRMLISLRYLLTRPGFQCHLPGKLAEVVIERTPLLVLSLPIIGGAIKLANCLKF